MSTQRRDNRNTQRPAIVAGTPVRRGLAAGLRGIFGAQLRSRSAIRSCPHPRLTATVHFATNSLQSDSRNTQLVRLVLGQLPRFLAPWVTPRAVPPRLRRTGLPPSASLPAPCVSISPCRVYR